MTELSANWKTWKIQGTCFPSRIHLFIFLIYFIDYAITVVPIFPFFTSTQYPHSLRQSPLSSCPWVMYISSLTTPLPILFLTSPYFVPTNLCFLIPAPFPPFSLSPLPTDNPPNGLQIYDFVPVLLVYLVCYLDSIIDSCVFIAILMFIEFLDQLYMLMNLKT